MTDDYRNILSDTSTPLGELTIHATTNAEFETVGDTDLFAINLTAGQSYFFQAITYGPYHFEWATINSEGKSYSLGWALDRRPARRKHFHRTADRHVYFIDAFHLLLHWPRPIQHNRRHVAHGKRRHLHRNGWAARRFSRCGNAQQR